MKTMKKLLALLLCLAMAMSLVVLVACDNETTGSSTEPTAGNSTDSSNNTDNSDNNSNDNTDDNTIEQIYNNAISKLRGLTNYCFTTEQVITSLGNVINQTVVAKQDGQNSYAKATNDLSPADEFEIWYVDEVYYAITADGSYKANIPYATYLEKYVVPGSTGSDALMNIPFAWFEDIALEQSGDFYYMELVVSGEEYKAYMNSTALDGMIDNAEDVTYKVYFTAEGELDNVVTEFSFVVDGAKFDVVSKTTVSNLGTTQITAPSNIDSFNDVTEQLNK